MKNIESALNEIVAGGTKIVSFNYDGETRNVLVGANVCASGDPVWGVQVNRALRVHGNRKYLIGLENNRGDNRPIKAFALDKIQNFSIA